MENVVSGTNRLSNITPCTYNWPADNWPVDNWPVDNSPVTFLRGRTIGR